LSSAYLTVHEVADRYGVAPGTVHNWTSKRTMPFRRPTGGRLLFAPADLDAFDAGCELEVREGKGRAVSVIPRASSGHGFLRSRKQHVSARAA